MKIKIIIALSVSTLFLTACPSENYTPATKKIQENNMDFPDLARVYYYGIHYELSDLFYTSYYDDFVLTDNADVRVIGDMNLYFSVENFDDDDAREYQYSFDEDISKLDAVHDNYALQRIESLYEPIVSVKKEVPKTVAFPGYMQVISGGEYEGDIPATYFMATLEIDGEFFVFQMIGKKENMGYLYDDFQDIISSVER